MTSKPVILVVGPTASGKSKFALALAEKFKGTIINADSMQIYRDLRILTARPDECYLRKAPHKLYGIFSIDRRCSVGEWRRQAINHISAIYHEERQPIVVGGTGLYIKALTDGIHAMPRVPLDIRRNLNERIRAHGAPVLYQELLNVDPETAYGLDPNDGQRIVRALEIFTHTGIGMSQWRRGQTETILPNVRFFNVLLAPPRHFLYQTIDARFERMINDGAVEEVEKLITLKPPKEHPLLKAVGVRPVIAYLNREIELHRMIQLGQRDSRRYAKRQLTWFRNKNIPNYRLEMKFSEIKMSEIFSEISKFLLTK